MTRLLRLTPAALLAALILLPFAAEAQNAQWRVERSSGEVWLLAGGAQPVSLGSEAVLRPGDSVRTGKNGRVLLIKGEETMLLSPNTALTLPESTPDGLRTNIQQQSGAVTITAEKRGQNHFQVDTPFLAAVVKGTQFTVTVDRTGARVAVREGRVEVSDYRTGQIALVLPSQTAQVAAAGGAGLQMSGNGPFNPLLQGAPRRAPVAPLAVPRGGLVPGIAPAPTLPNGSQQRASLGQNGQHNAVRLAPAATATRISAPIGQVNLDIAAASGRLARGGSHAPAIIATGSNVTTETQTASTTSRGSDTVWSSGTSGSAASAAARSAAAAASNSGGSASAAAATGGSSSGKGSGSSGTSNTVSASSSSGNTSSSVSADLGGATSVSGGNNGNGNGNGNSGHGNGNGGGGNGILSGSGKGSGLSK